jgi:hypothetical protein
MIARAKHEAGEWDGQSEIWIDDPYETYIQMERDKWTMPDDTSNQDLITVDRAAFTESGITPQHEWLLSWRQAPSSTHKSRRSTGQRSPQSMTRRLPTWYTPLIVEPDCRLFGDK